MTTQVTIQVGGEVNLNAAEGLVSRIRAAMRGGATDIVLKFDPGTAISSAEFLAFLATANRFLRDQGRTLRVEGAGGKIRELLRISRLDVLLAAPVATGGGS